MHAGRAMHYSCFGEFPINGSVDGAHGDGDGDGDGARDGVRRTCGADAPLTTSLGANAAAKLHDYSKRADCTWCPQRRQWRDLPLLQRGLLLQRLRRFRRPVQQTRRRLELLPLLLALLPAPYWHTSQCASYASSGTVPTLTSGGESSVRLTFGTSPLIFMVALLFAFGLILGLRSLHTILLAQLVTVSKNQCPAPNVCLTSIVGMHMLVLCGSSSADIQRTKRVSCSF